ncbi:thiol peroxidase [Campylobacter geochelonis]|uniref:Thiol peroxidase n=1 Tax=Campylobacter geochelonis TaxID=1780362 RepID=A0A128EB40_9BACT|nr:thiol peroxidase [Campylobacter geochelonis]QKF70361.1 lipid hydroperoxide peroxidase [Campylobacter geochelonis]CZE46190.1 thiol peroxidase (scavengase P20) [Campylobacter geochelonis]CZE46440.1 thiol peroxidase (scavengase P20) [Campylobacter geochelonis]CZE50755.1 thiol peroxidase (scavengase P20) [Campylobacter geochelonis]
MASVTVGGNVANLTGKELNVGDKAPVVELVAKDLSSIKVGGASDKIQVIAAVPSLDTGVCATETRKFNKDIAGQEGVLLTVVSMDLPFAMGRFCSTEGIENLQVGSDFRNKEFANAYGVLIKDGALAGLTARAVFVVGKDGTIIHKEIVAEVTTEPNYDAIVAAIKSQSGCGCHSSCSTK